MSNVTSTHAGSGVPALPGATGRKIRRHRTRGAVVRSVTALGVALGGLLAGAPAASATVHTISGDWDGDGRRTAATFDTASAVFTGNGQVFRYGRPGDTPLVGDWDGDGRDELAAHRGPYMYFKMDLAPGNGDVVIYYGRPGDVVEVGDWNGDGRDTVAVRRGADLHVKDTLGFGPADYIYRDGVKIGHAQATAPAPKPATAAPKPATAAPKPAPTPSAADRVRATLDRLGCADVTVTFTSSGGTFAGLAHWAEKPQRISIDTSAAPDDRLEYVAAHECAHIRQYDAYEANLDSRSSAYIAQETYARLAAATGLPGTLGTETLADCMANRWGYTGGSYTNDCQPWKPLVDDLLAGRAPGVA